MHVGPGALGGVARELGLATSAALVTDSTVARLHRAALTGLEALPTLELEPGESAKTLRTLEHVLEFLADAGLDRGSVVVALGGGVVGDVAGLAASLYMRGIGVVQCPTTLLAQVDASVGGKTAVNLAAGKNLAGTFHQPLAVHADTSVLATLDREEWRSGLGELVKTALLDEGDLLARLETEAAGLRERDPELLAELVERAVRVKAAVVAGDEREAGGRKALNLGHTFAHAIEHAAGYGSVPHGVAVAVGLCLALRASRALDLLAEPELEARARALLAALDLPCSLGELPGLSGRSAAALVAAMRLDKKARAGTPRFVLPVRRGEVALDVAPPPALLEELLAPAPDGGAG